MPRRPARPARAPSFFSPWNFRFDISRNLPYLRPLRACLPTGRHAGLFPQRPLILLPPLPPLNYAHAPFSRFYLSDAQTFCPGRQKQDNSGNRAADSPLLFFVLIAWLLLSAVLRANLLPTVCAFHMIDLACCRLPAGQGLVLPGTGSSGGICATIWSFKEK